MKSTVKLIAMLVAFAFCISGCGGGGSSSPAVEDSPNISSSSPDTPSSSPKKTPPSSPNGLANSIKLNPLRDLGLGAGDNVCFKVKSYNNVTKSDFSKAICSQIKNNNVLTLSWDNASGNVVGYYVYFGSNKNNASNFLADVFES